MSRSNKLISTTGSKTNVTEDECSQLCAAIACAQLFTVFIRRFNAYIVITSGNEIVHQTYFLTPVAAESVIVEWSAGTGSTRT